MLNSIYIGYLKLWQVVCLVGFNGLCFLQKSLSLEHARILFSFKTGLAVRLMGLQVCLAILPWKETLFIVAERAHVKESAWKRHLLVESAVRTGESSEVVLDRVNRVIYEVEIAGERMKYLRSYLNYLSKLLVLSLAVVLNFRRRLLLYTTGYLVGDFLLKCWERREFIRRQQTDLEVRTNRALILQRGWVVGEEEEVYRKWEQQESVNFRIEVHRDIRRALIRLSSEILCIVFIFGSFQYICDEGPNEDIKYFLSVHKKLEKISKCILKLV
ncbi:hypothetical protein NEHOM01_1461 [Nematocida homosporus]|uniref:uncharacterized protein n=1 Tax=Nematocida homosporus TaxID=1912981 RepID=UPI00221E4502|nr:uncharacterized protein NEHOM01_1461 [Nematocida homosporus]KAI5186428.1 hypothetical protein NEHOM01_1461 [Nematocida homosporus]